MLNFVTFTLYYANVVSFLGVKRDKTEESKLCLDFEEFVKIFVDNLFAMHGGGFTLLSFGC